VPRGESLSERFEVPAALRDEGLIRHLGLSNVDQAHLAEAQGIAPVAAIQNVFDPANAAEVALAHVLGWSPNVLAIPGTGSLAHLEENMAARSLTLTLRRHGGAGLTAPARIRKRARPCPNPPARSS
jgi:pyridoxine 4-dehydrogenase